MSSRRPTSEIIATLGEWSVAGSAADTNVQREALIRILENQEEILAKLNLIGQSLAFGPVVLEALKDMPPYVSENIVADEP